MTIFKTRKGLCLLSAAVLLLVGGVLLLVFTADTPYDIAPHLTRTDEALSILSPDKRTALTLTVQDGRLYCRVSRDDTVFLRDSSLGFTVDGTAYGTADAVSALGDVSGSLLTEVRTVQGRTAEANAPCIAVEIPVTDDFSLEARVFDNGAAFRYRLKGDAEVTRSLQSEETTFVLPEDCGVWGGESHRYHETIQKYWAPDRYTALMLGVPITVKMEDGQYAAILEGNLQHYPGIQLAWDKAYRYRADFGDDRAYPMTGEIVSPYRIVAVADDLNELYNNTIVYQVCDAPDTDLFADDWVKPGRAAWSWIDGRTVDSVTPDKMRSYTEAAAKLGFEYNIIDEGWVDWVNYRRKLETLAAEGEEYGVGQILWTGVTAGAGYQGGLDDVEDAKAYLDFIKALGMRGAKIDFFPDESHVETAVDLYTDILSYAAEQQLVINFHGCNKPTGLDAAYPNELNREAILGLESTEADNRTVLAQMFTTQPFIRNLAGHADFTPAVDDAFGMAQLVLTDAPMQAIATDPKEILRSKAREMIKSVPTVWEETVVLSPSALNRAAVFARRGANGSWYVGGINHTRDGEDLTLTLSEFLGEGTYTYELWIDGKKGLEKQTGTVTKDDTLTVPFATLEGFLLRFDRVTLSQYGGEITEAVTLTTADDRTVVRYTTDGTTPTASSPVWENGTSLMFEDTTVLTLSIEAPDGTHTVSYRFNKM